MSGFPLELVLFLVVGAGLLIRSLIRGLRGNPALRPGPEQMEGRTQTQDERDARAGAGPWASAADAAAARAVAASGPASQAAARRMAPRASGRARRFSRAALFPDRRAVQNAIVTSAILQPCHAKRARDTD